VTLNKISIEEVERLDDRTNARTAPPEKTERRKTEGQKERGGTAKRIFG
jgi:hypothetical protein